MEEPGEVSGQTNSVCKKNHGRCSKHAGHSGPCNKSNATHNFWKRSPILLNANIRKLESKQNQLDQDTVEAGRQLSDVKTDVEVLKIRKATYEMETLVLEENKEEKGRELQKMQEDKNKLEDDLDTVVKEYKKIKALLEKNSNSRKLRENKPTTIETIKDTSNSTRYKRQKETKEMLEYIHGGEVGALLGAWDYLRRYAQSELLEKLIVSYRRGKFIEKLYGKFTNVFEKSDSCMRQALATKYASHLSRRKYNFICKIQKSTFDSDIQKWSKKCIKYGDYNINLRTAQISHEAVQKFANSLDIGEIHLIPGHTGASRTVTALATMMIDLHLKVPSLRNNLTWFNGNTNHFVIEFSDDGAPESKESTMSIGSLTMWNLGGKVRSRDYHYPLHLVTAKEKDSVCEALWQQHTDEMLLLESSILDINDEKVTVEFQPSADQAWQFWANNVLTQSATYPSLFANVHKSELTLTGKTIGSNKEDTWKPPTMSSRKAELKQLEDFLKSLPPNLSEDSKHRKKLEFMGNNGLRQLGEPRINIFADRQRPEPLHLEINNWQHVLHVVYIEAVRRNKFEQFLSVLESPETVPSSEGKLGCGLKFVAQSIKEHFQTESNRFKKLSSRLIGSQAISLARYGYRLVDALSSLEEETDAQKIKRLALSKICETLRDIGALISRSNVSQYGTYPEDVKKACSRYFNLFSLFYKDYCNSTVWTLGYVVPYHATLLFEQYKVGYGILSMQGKEAKNSAIKQELKCGTNRSTSQDEKGKWQQIMRASYIRNFYLPYHFPVTSYHSHYQSRIPTFSSGEIQCQCSRFIQGDKDICTDCFDALDVIRDADTGVLSKETLVILKPIQCRICNMRFSDILLCDKHVTYKHNKNNRTKAENIVPLSCTILQLKTHLKQRNLSVSGNKEVLRIRLEGALACEQ